jgi:hypothetical protein
LSSQVTYLSDTSQELRVHDHATDQTCHWADIFKPLAFIAFRDVRLAQALQESPLFAGKALTTLDPTSYAAWLGEFGKNGLPNLLSVFIIVHDFRGPPSLPTIVGH